jgi:hypothetical protein
LGHGRSSLDGIKRAFWGDYREQKRKAISGLHALIEPSQQEEMRLDIESHGAATLF